TRGRSSNQTGSRFFSPGAEHLLQFERRGDLELIVAAVDRPLVGTPPHEDRRVPEARALHVVVLDFAHPLDAQRLPRQVLAGAPAALTAGHPRRVAAGVGPAAPWMPI